MLKTEKKEEKNNLEHFFKLPTDDEIKKFKEKSKKSKKNKKSKTVK